MRQGVMRTRAGALIILMGLTLPALGGKYQLTEERLGSRTAPLLLLTRADVQADLALTAEQITAGEQAIDSLYSQAEALRGRGNAPEVVAARKAIDESQRRWFVTWLQPSQRTRLLQIDLQWEGPAALVTRPTLIEELDLKPNQIQAIKADLKAVPGPGGDARARSEAEHRLAERALATLTAEQRERWKAMLGPPFAVRPTAKPGRIGP